MKKEDVKIGMKVVPHRKTGGTISWEHFNVPVTVEVQRIVNSFKKDGYLYVTRSEGKCFRLGSKANGAGDCVFNASDFEPYEERKSEMKYKVGDKVLIRSDLEVGKWYGADVVIADMKQCFGKVLTIARVGNEKYVVNENYRNWTEEMIERKIDMEFTKADLKTGDLVTYDDGDKGVVLLGTEFGDIVKCKKGYFTYLDDHEDDFKDGFCSIVKVERPINVEFSLLKSKGHHKVMWEVENV